MSTGNSAASSAGGLGGIALGGVSGLFGAAIGGGINVRIARQWRDWQERMANTAYQRAANDLEAAGLNRVLAFGQPAVTPNASAPQLPDLGVHTAGGIDRAYSLAQQRVNIAATGAQALAATSMGEKVGAEVERKETEERVYKAINKALDWFTDETSAKDVQRSHEGVKGISTPVPAPGEDPLNKLWDWWNGPGQKAGPDNDYGVTQ